MQVTKTPLKDLLILQPKRHGDARGWFCEVYSQPALAAVGIDLNFVQDNHSMSGPIGTLRGLHYQTPPMAQAKLVRCTHGVIFDVAVDVRRGSPTYGQWYGLELSADNAAQLLVPVGFLHGFVTRSEGAEVQYKVTAPYAPECDGGIAWDDPDIAIDWGLTSPILSAKDAAAASLAAFKSPFAYGAL
ncbi:MAG: dTDP-4-dehydrorhamnose 3,5-epimerase [Cypionkella sp.]|nr:dTDP-4-dehydrorhamnose 3,5-epimerase [Cypionkella sp.]